MKKEAPEKIIYNCHTHIFTINHVPQEFGKTIVPKWIKISHVRWFYKKFLEDGIKIKWLKAIISFFQKIDQLLSKVYFVKWIYIFLKAIVIWPLLILKDVLQVDLILNDQFKSLLNRYLNLVRYADTQPGRDEAFGGQDFVLRLLMDYYPSNTKFIVLPMDMEFMDAGLPKVSYKQQMVQLKALKQSDYFGDKILPFVFADPRRIETNPRKEIDYIIDLLEKDAFTGIKIYPALGYYPFDKNLIPIYEYAQEKEIPIITHCISGIVYYRGKKDPKWNYHPVLKQKKDQTISFISLPEKKNKNFTVNFTHPMNYECLLNPDLLNAYLGTNEDNRKDLSNLKICLAHFGGEDHWKKYLKDGSSDYGRQYLINRDPKTLRGKNNNQVWKHTSWLPIICDLMSTYKNLYTDISYILHDHHLMPVLKDLITQESAIRDKILYGTDFYVVNSQSTEKELFNEIKFFLEDDDFLRISNLNPRNFLSSKLNNF